MLYNETKWRTIVKTTSYRLLSSVATILLILLYGGTVLIKVGLLVVASELMIKPLFYFVHERAWNKIKFGKKCLLGYDDFNTDEE